jgi:hypothetical protein
VGKRAASSFRRLFGACGQVEGCGLSSGWQVKENAKEVSYEKRATLALVGRGTVDKHWRIPCGDNFPYKRIPSHNLL